MIIKKPKIIWITGLSGSGKSTLAKVIHNNLNQKKLPTILLDGDDMRKIFGAFTFNKNNHKLSRRIELALSYSRLCLYLNNQGFNVVIATISLYKDVLEWNKLNLNNYYEVFLDVPLNELRKRDPKGIYKSYFEGKAKNVAGLDLEVHKPKNPRWLFKFDNNLSIDDIASKIINDLYAT